MADTRDLYRQNGSASRSVAFVWDVTTSNWKLVVNGERMAMADEITAIGHASWSPDGTKLALSLAREPADVWRYEMVMVIDVARYLREHSDFAPVEVIDMQKRFCTYSFLGSFAEFITNRTLAVSMHKDGDPVSYIWEITTDGRRVRQLTF